MLDVQILTLGLVVLVGLKDARGYLLSSSALLLPAPLSLGIASPLPQFLPGLRCLQVSSLSLFGPVVVLLGNSNPGKRSGLCTPPLPALGPWFLTS